MANHELEADNWADDWVEKKVGALSPEVNWVPDSSRVFAQLHSRKAAKTRARAVAAKRWIWTTLAAGFAYSALLVLPASRACAEQPGECVLRVLGVGSRPVDIKPVQPVESVPAAVLPAPGRAADRPIVPATIRDYKEIGSVTAPVCLEVYIDYQCLHCQVLVRDVVPALTDEYLNTGKVKILYRDFPLPGHAYAKLAARYADAAGELGYFEMAMKQLFATRPVWSASGDIDGSLAQVLLADVMEKVRGRMERDNDPDAAFLTDMAAGQADHVDRTPFVVIVSGGIRHPVTDSEVTAEVLKARLDQFSAQ